tara:strand:- start:1 stop:141 length:141 start_codon:yes stop_codon:yes gene_type:complete
MKNIILNLVLMEVVDVDVKDINYKTYIKNRKLWHWKLQIVVLRKQY